MNTIQFFEQHKELKDVIFYILDGYCGKNSYDGITDIEMDTKTMTVYYLADNVEKKLCFPVDWLSLNREDILKQSQELKQKHNTIQDKKKLTRVIETRKLEQTSYLKDLFDLW